MRVYVATRFGDYAEAARVAELLVRAGHECTSRWIWIARDLEGACEYVTDEGERRKNALDDLDDIRRAHALIVLVPEEGGTGMWLELGFAMARGMRVLAVGPVQRRSIFGELVERYASVEEAVAALGAA